MAVYPALFLSHFHQSTDEEMGGALDAAVGTLDRFDDVECEIPEITTKVGVRM